MFLVNFLLVKGWQAWINLCLLSFCTKDERCPVAFFFYFRLIHLNTNFTVIRHLWFDHFLAVFAFSCPVAFPPVTGQRVPRCHNSSLVHSSSTLPFSCTQGHKGCWSLSQLSWPVGSLSQNTETNNLPHLHPDSSVSNLAFLSFKPEIHILTNIRLRT